jgi:prevent-host-death family protein
MPEAVTTSATDFKQHVGKYLDVARTGPVIIEKQGRPAAVLISVEEYEALNPSASRVIDRLVEEFDALVARMQRRDFERAMQKAFDASPAELGAGHRRRMKRRAP